MSKHFLIGRVARATVCLAMLATTLVPLTARAQSCPFDDGRSSLAVEGLILTRYALGITGAPLVASTGISAVDATTVEAAINCPSCALNITGNAAMTAADATIISRKLAGFSGASLTNGLALGSGTRSTPAAVQSFLLSGCGTAVNGFVQGGNSFGTTAVLGTNDNNYLEFRANGSRVMRFEPNSVSLNIVAGSASNFIGVGIYGATLLGGGSTNNICGFFADQPCANKVTERFGTVTGGAANIASGYASTVGGGGSNDAGGNPGGYATIAGGFSNRAWGASSVVGGGAGNWANGSRAMVGGGSSNSATGDLSVVAGGDSNTASAGSSSVGGGTSNVASAGATTVSGGTTNGATADYAAVGGGYHNVANGGGSAVGGGGFNTASGANSVVAGGGANVASGAYSFVAGGADNNATADYSVVAGGARNVASGAYSFVAGGADNEACGDYNFAAGRRAKSGRFYAGSACAAGNFTFADSSDADFFAPGASDSFSVRAHGGVFFQMTNLSTGWMCYATQGTGWTCSSDRNLKRNLAATTGQSTLAKVTAMPVYRWQPKDGPNKEIWHIGPMAQDFYAAFALGDSDKSIGLLDASGVALAAIQGLNEKVDEGTAALAKLMQEKDGKIAILTERVAQLEAANVASTQLREELAALRRLVDVLMAGATSERRVAQAFSQLAQ